MCPSCTPADTTSTSHACWVPPDCLPTIRTSGAARSWPYSSRPRRPATGPAGCSPMLSWTVSRRPTSPSPSTCCPTWRATSPPCPARSSRTTRFEAQGGQIAHTLLIPCRDNRIRQKWLRHTPSDGRHPRPVSNAAGSPSSQLLPWIHPGSFATISGSVSACHSDLSVRFCGTGEIPPVNSTHRQGPHLVAPFTG